MEIWERNQIRSNWPELIEATNCDPILISNLMTRGVISTADYECLRAIPGKFEQAIKFYEIIQTRPGSYDALLEALDKAQQSGAALILRKGHANNKESSPSFSQSSTHHPTTIPSRVGKIAHDDPVVENSDKRLKLIPPTISKSPFIRCEAWEEFAEYIGVSKESIEVLRQEQVNGTLHNANMIHIVYDLWIVKAKSNGPTVDMRSLIYAIENICEDYLTGDYLRLQFNFPCKGAESGYIGWDDLSPGFQARVKETVGLMLSRNKKLNGEKLTDYDNMLLKEYGTTWRTLFSGVQANVLTDLSMGKIPNLKFNNLIPLTDYSDIPVIYPNNVILPSTLFSYSCTDIFLFTGIERQRLSRLAKRRTTSTTEQLEGISARFMILDKPDHYEKIYAITGEPVHLLHFENDRFHWVATKGEIDVVRKCAKSSEMGIPLHEFLKNKFGDSSSRICLFKEDDFGVVDLHILSCIGKELTSMFPERVIICDSIYTIYTKCKSVEAMRMKSEIEAVLLNMVCENDLEKIVVRDRLHSENVSIELLLHSFGFSESYYRHPIVDFIQIIHASFKSIRLWMIMSSRSSKHLEKHMCVLCNTLAVSYNRVLGGNPQWRMS